MGHYVHHPFFGIRRTFGTNQYKFCLVTLNEYWRPMQTLGRYAQAVSPNIYADKDLCKENERKDDDDDESSCSDDEVSSAEEEDDSDDDLM